MNIQEHVPLAPLTTLKVGGNARYFVSVHTVAELTEAVKFAKEKSLPFYVLGGGSNVLFSDEGYLGLVIHIALLGRKYETVGEKVSVTIASGELLDEIVEETVSKGLWGLENLSHIPGSVGAVPVQNVGAYGVEAKDIIESVEVYDCQSRKIKRLNTDDCQFGYRDSIFKQQEGSPYIITSVTFVLATTPNPKILYNDLVYLKDCSELTPRTVRDSVIEIRSKKFPDWQKVGTAGSFFKNPTIDRKQFEVLKEKYPQLPGYETTDNKIKIPLGWVLENILNLKGHTEGEVGLFKNQALVLVNYGNASSKKITAYSETVIKQVHDATGIIVEREVTKVDS